MRLRRRPDLRYRCFVTATVLIAAHTCLVTAQSQSMPAVPLEPITVILDAFRTHDIVALSEGRHNNEQGHAFRLALIRDPRFADTVNDIVVESGGAQHQAIIDRFVRGESVSDADLRRVWLDTTQPHQVWDVPIYEEFFRAVRALNASRPRERQLRVLLGDPPFDWSTATRESWLRVERDRFTAELIQREVLSKQRRALVIYGGTHIMRRSPLASYTRLPTNIVTLLSASGATRIFNIWTHTEGGDLSALQPDIASWRPPMLALTKNSTLGAASYRFYLLGSGGESPRMEDQFDAVLYLGPLSTITDSGIAASSCADAEYLAMRLGRMALVETGPPPPGVKSPADRLREDCRASR